MLLTQQLQDETKKWSRRCVEYRLYTLDQATWLKLQRQVLAWDQQACRQLCEAATQAGQTPAIIRARAAATHVLFRYLENRSNGGFEWTAHRRWVTELVSSWVDRALKSDPAVHEVMIHLIRHPEVGSNLLLNEEWRSTPASEFMTSGPRLLAYLEKELSHSPTLSEEGRTLLHFQLQWIYQYNDIAQGISCCDLDRKQRLQKLQALAQPDNGVSARGQDQAQARDTVCSLMWFDLKNEWCDDKQRAAVFQDMVKSEKAPNYCYYITCWWRDGGMQFLPGALPVPEEQRLPVERLKVLQRRAEDGDRYAARDLVSWYLDCGEKDEKEMSEALVRSLPDSATRVSRVMALERLHPRGVISHLLVQQVACQRQGELPFGSVSLETRLSWLREHASGPGSLCAEEALGMLVRHFTSYLACAKEHEGVGHFPFYHLLKGGMSPVEALLELRDLSKLRSGVEAIHESYCPVARSLVPVPRQIQTLLEDGRTNYPYDVSNIARIITRELQPAAAEKKELQRLAQPVEDTIRLVSVWYQALCASSVPVSVHGRPMSNLER